MQIALKQQVRCAECPIRHRAVCARCDDDELTLLESMKSYKSYEAGEPILWRGDDLMFVASVVQGVAALSKTLEDGRTQMVGLLLPSDFIGRPGRTEIDFDSVDVNGELIKPVGALLIERKRAQFNPLIKLRQDFKPEMKRSIKQVQ